MPRLACAYTRRIYAHVVARFVETCNPYFSVSYFESRRVSFETEPIIFSINQNEVHLSDSIRVRHQPNEYCKRRSGGTDTQRTNSGVSVRRDWHRLGRVEGSSHFISRDFRTIRDFRTNRDFRTIFILQYVSNYSAYNYNYIVIIQRIVIQINWFIQTYLWKVHESFRDRSWRWELQRVLSPLLIASGYCSTSREGRCSTAGRNERSFPLPRGLCRLYQS